MTHPAYFFFLANNLSLFYMLFCKNHVRPKGLQLHVSTVIVSMLAVCLILYDL